jgi:CubicO group peptidase (beta-lactamase class C family)
MTGFSMKALLYAAALAWLSTTAFADAPFIDPSTDAERLPPAQNILFWTPEQQVVGYRNVEKIFPTRVIEAGGEILDLPQSPIDLGSLRVRSGGRDMSVDEYFQRQNVAGLIAVRNGAIAYERYGLGNTPDSRWISFSVAKSVTSLLVGAAVRDGYIRSVDEMATDYLPRLKGSSYDRSSIRSILQMSSGVAWTEDYADPESDVSRATYQTLALYEFLRHKPRNAEPGVLFNYNTAETNLVGTLLRSAIGNNLSTYLSEKIWKPFGMESDAVWMLTEPGGGEFGGCCIAATLRDYARLGLFALAEGRLANGAEVLADGWMTDSTRPSPGWDGYGYLWWLGKGEAFRGIGIFGQGICIHPDEGVVVALHSARGEASNDEDWALQVALCDAIAEHLDQGD